MTGNNIIGGNNTFGTLTNDDIKIVTNNTQRAVIQAGGNMGIKQLLPSTTLDVDCTPPGPAPSGLQFENLPFGHGQALVVDPVTGYVYMAQTALKKEASSDDLQSQIDALKQELDQLKSSLKSLGLGSFGNGVNFSITPNPSNNEFRVTYSYPGNFTNGAIKVTDETGRVISSIPVSSGNGTEVVTMPDNAASGNFIVSLIIDGAQVAQQKEVLVR